MRTTLHETSLINADYFLVQPDTICRKGREGAWFAVGIIFTILGLHCHFSAVNGVHVDLDALLGSKVTSVSQATLWRPEALISRHSIRLIAFQ
jgi:hypothetical protein